MKSKLVKPKIEFNQILVAIFRFLFIAAFAYVLLYPIIFIISGALKDPLNFNDPTVVWVPKTFTKENFEHAIIALDLKSAVRNTIVFEVLTAAIQVFTCAVAAYGLARFDFAYKKILYVFMLLTILVPVQMILIPSVINFKGLDFMGILGMVYNFTGYEFRPNVLDTVWAFYLPAIFSVGLRGGLFIFIYMQFFKGLPKELEEAAWIDGASPIKTFFRIIIPSSSVVFVTVSIFSFIWHWNDYYLALMYTSSNKTLAVMLSRILTSLRSQGYYELTPESAGAALAGCALYIIVPLVLYMVLQKKFVRSIERVGIVG